MGVTEGGWPDTFGDLIQEVRSLRGDDAAETASLLMRKIGYDLNEELDPFAARQLLVQAGLDPTDFGLDPGAEN